MNKIYFLSFILCVINIGCVSTHKSIKLKFSEDKRIKIKIPNNFVFEGLEGDYEKEYRYWYSDSSVIYVTTFENTINYEVIRQQETYYDRFNAFHSKDTLTLEGRKSDGTYWKDKLLETGVTIGYSRVPQNRLKEFTDALYSIKK